MSAPSDTLVLAGLGIRWKDAPSFCTGFSGEAEPVMTFSGSPMQHSYGISYCAAPAAHHLTDGVGGSLAASADWSRVEAYTAKDPEHALALAAICSRFARFDTVLAHAAAVAYREEGVVFVGPSGIGKTTQAQLWQRHLDAQIINGDKILLRCFPDGIRACGLPWKGSSPYCLDRQVPLRAVVALRQSGEDRIRRLTVLECMEYFLPHVFLPHWDPACLDLALDTVSQLIEQLPMYLLECCPDEAAVELTRKTIF